MTETNGKASVYKKMALVMAEIGRIPKAGKNTKFNYDFVTAEDIKDVVRKAMAKHNLALLMNLTDYDLETIKTSGGGSGTKVRGNISYTLACGDTGESVTSIMPMEAIDYQDKVFSKLYTIGLKYFLIDTFCISTGDETDPDGETNAPTITEVTKNKKPAAKAAKSEAPADPWAKVKTEGIRLFCEAVRAKTNYYNGPEHLFHSVNGWPIAKDEADFAAKLNAAIDHANNKDETDQAPLFAEDEEQTTYGND